MLNTLLVMAGGAIGAALRYQFGRLAGWQFGSAWPWGTLGVNIIGSLAMGLLAGWLAMRAQGSESLRLFLAVGVLGGFTTFSSFSLEMMLMIERGALLSAMGYALASVVGAAAGLALGLTAARALA